LTPLVARRDDIAGQIEQHEIALRRVIADATIYAVRVSDRRRFTICARF
jgi:hypothetical protein